MNVMNRPAVHPKWQGFAVAGAVFVLDRLTKFIIESCVEAWETVVVIPRVFNIVHVRNRGAAFGMLAHAPDSLRTLLLIGLSAAVLVALSAMLWRLPARGPARWPAAALALVLGGAVGNLYDRVLRGTVVDFLQVFIGAYEWPSFNVADSAITVGAALLLFDMWRGRRPAAT